MADPVMSVQSDKVIDTNTEEESATICKPENALFQTESGGIDSENKVSSIIADEMSILEPNQVGANTLQNQENKSVFLKAIELSPCKLDTVELSCNLSSSDTNINSDTINEVQSAEISVALLEKSDVEIIESQDAPAAVNLYNEIYDPKTFSYESDLPNNIGCMKTNDKEIVDSSIEALKKSDNKNICAEKDVHFSSPLAIIHEYSVSQGSCSQSTVSLRDSDDSQNMDSDNDKRGQSVNDSSLSTSVTELISTVASITPGGDCFSVQVGETIGDIKKMTEYNLNEIENNLSEMKNSDDVTGTIKSISLGKGCTNICQITQEQSNNECRNKGTADISCALKNSEMKCYLNAGIDLVTRESFGKLPLNDRYSDQIEEESQLKLAAKDHDSNAEQRLNSANSTNICAQKIEIGAITDLKERNSVYTSSKEKITCNDKADFSDDEKISTLLSQSAEQFEHKMENTTQDVTNRNANKLPSPELPRNSSQDLFESHSEERNQEGSDHMVLPSKKTLADCDKNNRNITAKNEIEPSCITKENCQNDETVKAVINNIHDVYSESISQTSDYMNKVANDENLTDVIADDSEDNSQKVLFESDTSSESVRQVEEIKSGFVQKITEHGEQNQTVGLLYRTDNDMLVEQTKEEDAIPATEGALNTACSEFYLKSKEICTKKMFIGDSVKKCEKRKTDEINIIPKSKRSRVSKEDTLKPVKRHSLFKTFDHNDKEIPAKKANFSETERTNFEEKAISSSSNANQFMPKTLASIVSDVINSLEENIVWTPKPIYTDSNTDACEKSLNSIVAAHDKDCKDSGDSNKDSQDKIQSVSSNDMRSEAENGELSTGILSSTDKSVDIEETGQMENDHNNIPAFSKVTLSSTVTENLNASNTNSEHSSEKEDCLDTGNKEEAIFDEKHTTNKLEEVNGSPVFMSALEYLSQNSSTGFEPRACSQELVISSQGSSHSIPVVHCSNVHSVTEVSEDGLETANISNTVNYGALLDSLVDSAVDHVVPDGVEKEEQLEELPDESTETLYRDTLQDSKSESKIYACDADICYQDGTPVCKPLDEPSSSLLNMEEQTLSSYSKCFNWKYTPSYDDSGAPLATGSDDDSNMIKIAPLKTCGKPIRVGLSRRQRVNSLHNLKYT